MISRLVGMVTAREMWGRNQSRNLMKEGCGLPPREKMMGSKSLRRGRSRAILCLNIANLTAVYNSHAAPSA